MGKLLSISFDFDYYPLFIVLAIAWLIPMLMTFFRIKRIPTVVLEILAGYFIGKYLLGTAPQESLKYVEFLALTGFIFLMFLSGLEIDMDQIISSLPRRKIRLQSVFRNPLIVGLIIFFLTLLLSFIGSLIIDNFVRLENIWYFSLIMVTTSVGIILPVLKNRGEVKTGFGQAVIVAAAVADVFSIVLFTITAFVLKEGLRFDLLWIMLLAGSFIVLYIAGKLLSRFSFYEKFTFQLSHAASQIKVRGTMLLILVFVVLSQVIGKEVILLGAFLGGLLLSIFLHKDRSLLLLKLDGMGYGFFIPVFFIMVGVKFNAQALLEFDKSLYVFLALLILTLYAVKVIPALIWSGLFGFRKAISGGFLISSRLSLIIAASTIGLELGVISEGMNACFIMMAVVTCLLSPVLYDQINKKSKFPADKTVIVGGSSTAVLLARRMKMHNRDAVLIEKDKTRCDEINEKGISCIQGDGTDVSVYNKVKLLKQNYVVILTPSDDENIRISSLLRKDMNHERVITKANKQRIQKALNKLEVEYFDVTRLVAVAIESLIIRPTTYHTLIESFESYHVEEMEITNSDIDGVQIKNIPIHSDCTLMLIRRANNMYIPHGETYLKRGDVVNVFGTVTALDDIRSKFV